jgi:hypothetical protein
MLLHTANQCVVRVAQVVNIIGAIAHQQGLPWLLWQIVPNARSRDYEFFTRDQTTWAAFEQQVYWTPSSPSPFQWPEIWI